MRGRAVVAAVLAGLPLLATVVGPFVAAGVESPPGAPYVLTGPYLLGTDGLGRDVFGQLLRGGPSTLLVALVSITGAYLLGGLAGLLAASSRRRWVDEVLLRPLDVLLAVPSLLLISVVAVWWQAEAWAVAVVVGVVNAPAVARLVRGAALDASSSGVAEALALQGQSWWRVHSGYVARAVARPVAADIGTRVTAAVYLIAAVNFLGLGADPTSADWAVSVARNRNALLLQPWSVLAPALVVVCFTVGMNLLGDRAMTSKEVPS
ncbi:ABC transporter permease subunit [Lentzea sp.]|uniref:ABC transporter permease subunit n=1 Tax=Lentzea sp. TaxID=56099 RepID=UPI002ED32370